MKEFYGQKVHVVANNRTGEGGKVIERGWKAYTPEHPSVWKPLFRSTHFCLENCHVEIDQDMRDDVLRTGRTNIHAWMVGTVCRLQPITEWDRVTYTVDQGFLVGWPQEEFKKAAFACFNVKGLFVSGR